MQRQLLYRSILRGALVAAAAAMLQTASAQDWTPSRNVEIIVTTGPGGAQDRTARVMQGILQNPQILKTPLTVVNKPGGGGTLGLTYLVQHPADGHFLLTTSPTILANHVLGISKLTHTDVKPVAQLFSEYVGFAVRADSPVKDARDLLERIKSNPSAFSAAIATSAGNHNHIAIGLVMKTAGVDLKRLKIVVFKASGEAVTAVLGGHIDFIATTASNLVRLANEGKVRVVAVAAPSRLTGPLAAVPTWRELGVNAIGNNWRGIAASKDTPAAQIQFWENTLEKMAASPEWKKEIESNLWVDNFMRSAASAEEYRRQYVETRDVLTDIGLAK